MNPDEKMTEELAGVLDKYKADEISAMVCMVGLLYVRGISLSQIVSVYNEWREEARKAH